MIKISNTNVVNIPLPNILNLIKNTHDNAPISINVKIPMKQSSFSFETLHNKLSFNEINNDYTKDLAITNLTFESLDANIINSIDLRWGQYNTTVSNPNHESTVTIPITCWFFPNDLSFTSKYFDVFFQDPSTLPEFINCTIQLVKLSRTWFEFFVENGGVFFLKDKYFISTNGVNSKPYSHPPIIEKSIKKTMHVSPINDESKVFAKLWYRNQEDLNLIHALPGFISEHKQDDPFSFEKNLGDALPFKKYYFNNCDIKNTFKNSKSVAYYKIYQHHYDPSETLKTQYEEKLNDLVVNFSKIMREENSDLKDNFNVENDLKMLKKSFTDKYRKEYNQYIESKQFDTVENISEEVEEIEKVIEKVEVSDMAFLTFPVQRNVTIFYSDKTVQIDTLFEPNIISMYGHFMDEVTRKYLKIN